MKSHLTVAISSGFLDSFAKLPRKIQSKTSSFINKFKNDPLSPGINYEKIASADEKLCSIRIDDTYRGIIMRDKEEGVYLLLWVDHHDKAYAWAQRRKVAVNRKTGTLQVYETVNGGQIDGSSSAPALFASVPDEALAELGVPEDLISYVRSIADKDVFSTSAEILPPDAYENLSWIANDIPLEEVLDMVRSEAAGNSNGGFSEALSRPESQRSFVVVEGEEELFQILSAPLEKWRVFLHPSQRKLVTRAYRGPARVLGAAGTGKTVVAMHRAKYLAESICRAPQGPSSGSRQRILFTTFSTTLAADIKSNLQKICNVDEMRAIDVVNLDAWVARYLRQNEMNFKIEYEEDVLDSIWSEAISDSGTSLDFSPAFYAGEWSQIVLAQDVENAAGYAHARRTGRGVRLGRHQRLEVWSVIERYRQLMKDRQLRDVDFAMSECEKLVLNSTDNGLYDHIVVDEGQDFSAPAYRLLKALVGKEHENDLFIVGDAHQRIYGKRAVLSRCGINIRGRGTILRINYRTTEEIRSKAMGLLDGLGFDDLDNGSDDGRSQSLLHGLAPTVNGFSNIEEEISYVSSCIRESHASGVDYRDMCVVARDKKTLSAFEHELRERDIPTCPLISRKPDDRKAEGARFASMHRVKGLEFDCVFVVGLSDDKVPPRAALRRARSEGTVEELLKSERCLLYVALTRARENVFISFSGNKSKLL